MTARGTTRPEKWTAPLLVVPAGQDGGRTLVAAGRIDAGVFVWKLPTLGAAR